MENGCGRGKEKRRGKFIVIAWWSGGNILLMSACVLFSFSTIVSHVNVEFQLTDAPAWVSATHVRP